GRGRNRHRNRRETESIAIPIPIPTPDWDRLLLDHVRSSELRTQTLTQHLEELCSSEVLTSGSSASCPAV
ncbi:MAG: hypothetical protein ABSH28_06905, partial [Acidobacteriota bacterium]